MPLKKFAVEAAHGNGPAESLNRNRVFGLHLSFQVGLVPVAPDCWGSHVEPVLADLKRKT